MQITKLPLPLAISLMAILSSLSSRGSASDFQMGSNSELTLSPHETAYLWAQKSYSSLPDSYKTTRKDLTQNIQRKFESIPQKNDLLLGNVQIVVTRLIKNKSADRYSQKHVTNFLVTALAAVSRKESKIMLLPDTKVALVNYYREFVQEDENRGHRKWVLNQADDLSEEIFEWMGTRPSEYKKAFREKPIKNESYPKSPQKRKSEDLKVITIEWEEKI